jgi:alpha/beta superfamily hydrolase
LPSSLARKLSFLSFQPLGARYLLAPSLSASLPSSSSTYPSSEGGSSSARTLAIYTTEDDFTGIERYRSWAKANESDGLQVVEVKGEGHFWNQKTGESRSLLEREIARWIEARSQE